MNPVEDELLQSFRRVCQRLNWKQTASRFSVYRYLWKNKTHPKVDEVWEAVKCDIPAISRSSIFRILEDFADKGLISVLERSDTVARYDANPQPHDHFFCTQCKRVFDLDITEIDENARAVANRIGRVEYFETRAVGVCRECLKRQSEKCSEKPFYSE